MYVLIYRLSKGCRLAITPPQVDSKVQFFKLFKTFLKLLRLYTLIILILYFSIVFLL